MTTQVLIVNKGPQAVKVEVMGRDAEGQFEAGEEKVVPARDFVEIYVHDAQSFQVHELKQQG